MGRVLAEVLQEHAKRVSDLVMALKQYTYLDRSPVLNVNVHDGLESTLIMLNSRLGRGIQVHRDYAEDLPPIEAYSSELNQVWTDLIDNAAAAMYERMARGTDVTHAAGEWRGDRRSDR
ncbi:MAG: hypothetical protein U0452_12325 [Anaerolineae bacterium]